MRMWLGIDPKRLCRKHLLGEHVEMHMLVGSINKGTSIEGYVTSGLINPFIIRERHDDIAAEMVRRGYNHKSPLPSFKLPTGLVPSYNFRAVERDLATRCVDCRRRLGLKHVYQENHQ